MTRNLIILIVFPCGTPIGTLSDQQNKSSKRAIKRCARPSWRSEAGLFSPKPDLLLWWITVWLYQTPLLCIRKVRKINQNLHLWVAWFITATRAFAAIEILAQMYVLLNGWCGHVYKMKFLLESGLVRAIFSAAIEIRVYPPPKPPKKEQKDIIFKKCATLIRMIVFEFNKNN